MGIKIKNLQTGEFEKFNIPALKGEKGEPGEIEPSEKVDYIGKQHSKLRDTMNANVDYIIKTAIGEFNYLDYEGQHITATNSIEGHAKSAILSGQTLVNHKNNNVVISPDLSNCYDYTLNGCKRNANYLIKFNAVHDEDVMVGFLIDPSTWSTPTTELKWANPGNITVIVNSGSNPNYLRIRAKSCENLMIIEYQDGMENWDIPYFDGMTSNLRLVITVEEQITSYVKRLNLKN